MFYGLNPNPYWELICPAITTVRAIAFDSPQYWAGTKNSLWSDCTRL